ncbi:MAG: TonB-dependent receptor [Caulobacteraceae bacterium]|nr:TonB-dependent receptor [Caulobacteraceae bacterium]
MHSTRKLLLGASALAGFMALGASLSPQAALAQTQSAASAPPSTTTTTTTTTSAPADENPNIIVTGSRIKKSNYTSAAPIQVINSETATLEGMADTGSLLQKQPIASGSFQVNGLLSAYVNTGGPGVETISLRGLGSQRTLVLLDGQRLGPAGVRGTVGPVDLNTIPESIIDRTEILKDGASSIYGSDAVAGVVNFITKKNLDGGTMSVFGDVPTRAGGSQYEINGTFGKTFDRGYVQAAIDFSDQEEQTLGQRNYTKCATDNVYDPTTGARLDYIDPSTGKAKCYNVFTGVAETVSQNPFTHAGYGGAFQYSVPGITYPGSAGGNTISSIFPNLANIGIVRAGRSSPSPATAYLTATQPYLNYDSPLYARSTAITPYKRYTLYVNGGFDLTPKTEIYGSLLYNRRESQQHGYQQMFPTVSGNNPNNIFQQYYDAAGHVVSAPVEGGQTVGYDALPVIAFKSDQSQTVDYVRGTLGFKGSLPAAVPVLGNWKWDIYGEVSHSYGSYTTDFAYNDRINAVTGDLACDQSQMTIMPVVACPNGGSGIPWFSQRVLGGNFTAEEKAFLFGQATGHTSYDQQLVEGVISGDLFKLPAGPVGAALGFTVRHEAIDDEPSNQEISGNMYNVTSAGVTKGDDTVKELFGEVNIPIIKGAPFIQSLSMEVSGRYTDYRSYGSNSTYKVGGDWQIVPWLRLRGTLGTSFRAPSLYELYLGNQTSYLDQSSIDPCINYGSSSNATLRANCAAAGLLPDFLGGSAGALVTTGGGKGHLKAETSFADTIGIVFTPSFADLSVAVDYFDITVSNEIREFGANNIAAGCYSSTIYPHDPLCAFITRDTNPNSATYQGITSVEDNYINVAQEVNRGIDLDVRYKRTVGQIKFTFESQLTWQFQDRTQLLAGSVPEDSNGTTTEPAFTGQIQLRADRGDWTVFWTTDLYGKASDTGLLSFQYTDVHYSGRYAQDVYYKQYTEFTAYHSVTVRRKFDKWTAELGIQNLFDEPPPSLSGNETFRAGNAALNAYDLRGRRVFFQIDRRF